MKKQYFLLLACMAGLLQMNAQPLLETGAQQMPSSRIDKDTHHRVMRLTNNGRSNMSFYFLTILLLVTAWCFTALRLNC